MKSSYDSLHYCRGTSTSLCQCLRDTARHKVVVSLASYSTPTYNETLFVFMCFKRLCMKMEEEKEEEKEEEEEEVEEKEGRRKRFFYNNSKINYPL